MTIDWQMEADRANRLYAAAFRCVEKLNADLKLAKEQHMTDTDLRLLVDIVWQHATESTAVPFTKTADMLIAKYRAALAPEQDK